VSAPAEEPNDTRAPLFGTWRRAYLAVVVIFGVELAFFAFISRYFS
jgi:hypothetical protein